MYDFLVQVCITKDPETTLKRPPLVSDYHTYKLNNEQHSFWARLFNYKEDFMSICINTVMSFCKK